MSKILAIRQYYFKFFPCIQRNLLENPHVLLVKTGSYSIGSVER